MTPAKTVQSKDEQPMLTLVTAVVEAIEQGIRSGRYLPGTQLVERDLAAELGVSRVPVREAIRRLAAQQILEIRPYRGAVVRKLSRRDVTDVMDILRALGIASIARAAERIEEKGHRRQFQSFVSSHLTQRKPEHKIKQWLDVNYEFYQLIATISGNRQMPELLKQFQLQLYRLVSNINLDAASKSSSITDQRSIAEAILEGDARKALQAYERHLAHVFETIDRMPDTAFAKD